MGLRMVDVFISRPTWVSEEFRIGLQGFLSFLDTHEIKPRTIGSTDYPTTAPLDAVIAIMNECAGAIILGYPQISVTEGKVRDTEVDSLLLPTEWNHIEAALAYHNKLPLLIVHHKNIVRGIFEHGALSSFVYEKDLSEPNWFLAENIAGAIKNWKSALAKDSPKNHPTTQPPPPSPIPAPKINAELETILVKVFNSPFEMISQYDIESMSGGKPQLAQYYIEQLMKADMIYDLGTGQFFSLTAKAREYVVDNRLAKP